MKRVWSGLCCVILAAILAACGEKNVPLHITTEKMEMDGITKSYRLMFITDTHCVVTSDNDSDEIQEYANNRHDMFLGPDGEESKDMLSALIEYGREKKVDGFLLGGDIIDCPSDSNLAFLEEQLQKIAGRYLYTPGNHDWTFPWEYMTDRGRKELLPKLEKYMDGNTAVHRMDFGEFCVVAVDDSTNQVDEEALEAYEAILAEKKPVILITHIPFITQSALTKARENWNSPVVIGGGNYGGIYPNETSMRFMELTTAAESPVRLILTGHVHFFDKDYLDGPKPVLQLVGEAGYLGAAIELEIVPQTENADLSR